MATSTFELKNKNTQDFSDLDQVSLREAFKRARQKYGTLATRKKIDERIPEDIRDENVHIKLLMFLLGKGSDTEETGFKQLVLKELFPNSTANLAKIIELLKKYISAKSQSEPNYKKLLNMELLKRSKYYFFDRQIIALIDCGADPNIKNENGYTLLHRCIMDKQHLQSFMKDLKQHGANSEEVSIALGLNSHAETPLQYFLRKVFETKELDITQALNVMAVVSESNVNTKGPYDRTLLHIFVNLIGYIPIADCITELVKNYKADINQQNAHSHTPLASFLTRAVRTQANYALTSPIRFLLELGANPNIPVLRYPQPDLPPKQYSLLHWLALQAMDLSNVLKILIEHGAKLIPPNMQAKDPNNNNEPKMIKRSDNGNENEIADKFHQSVVDEILNSKAHSANKKIIKQYFQQKKEYSKSRFWPKTPTQSDIELKTVFSVPTLT